MALKIEPRICGGDKMRPGNAGGWNMLTASLFLSWSFFMQDVACSRPGHPASPRSGRRLPELLSSFQQRNMRINPFQPECKRPFRTGRRFSRP